MSELPKAYDPRQSEARWYEFWETEGLFTASADPSDHRKPYTIAIPPFNVTGSLHMGHACRVTYEDALIRYHRMLGRNALWIPGTDHAGIATQVVVERQLAREGKPFPPEEEAAIRDPILEKYETEGSPYYSTARLWDDGILDPVDTRDALGLGIAMSHNAPLAAPRTGVFRM